MKMRPRNSVVRALGAVVLVAAASLVSPASAASPTGLEQAVLVNAREQPVGRFLEEVLGQADLPVRVDSDVRGTVNGDFDASAGSILDDIVASFRLSTYWDGATLWVYPANDTVRDLVYVPPGRAKKVVDSAHRLGLVDDRNRLSVSGIGVVATGSERFVEQVREIADAVQRGAQEQVPADVMRVFKLKYAWAGDVVLVAGGQEVLVPGVASLLGQLIEPGALGAAARPARVRLPRSREGLRGQGLRAVGEVTEDSSPSTVTPLPPSAGSTRDTRIVADTLNNAVVIRDRSDRMASYEALIASLDVEPEMIELEATIIDLNTDRLRELGIDWRLRGDDAAALFGGIDTSDPTLESRAPGGVVSLVLGDSTTFVSRIRALETQGAARVVSKPHVMTLSNVEALLDTTSTFFVRVAGDEEVDLFDVSVGTTLRVVPHVFEGRDGARIKLRVNIEDGSTTNRSVDAIPVIERSTINTQALINEGESLLIGGLVRQFDASSVSKVPGFGSIPVLGALFRNTETSTRRVERMFLITPRINLRAGIGQRYDVPFLQGSEGAILESAPRRIEPALAGVAARDRDYPTPQPLPRVGGEASVVVPGRPTFEAGPGANAERGERTRGGVPGGDESPPSSWPDDGPRSFDAADGWQSVSAPEPERRAADALAPEPGARRADEVLDVSAPKAFDDPFAADGSGEWQAVVR